ncbi:hypothetical protein X765_01085 [Mesorhizobium sp. LSHC440B00]|nr:hypothetical protein X765_01085 [Mesorhizobium sp. LSHC440B00]ESX33828.1 hypothetical protein X764_29280 [Mesorhizobium sp. LSHC440A00]ESX40115.1 hypothetical protein X763_07325 [Mesorhizobium sp. LSHC432A00]ESX71184.1 hypothetical protein X757_23585 [Mesorhizobium sp. LSHC414A00]ESZ32076.1 hypothetical protein X731_31960 [Mesorhizobium sp. L2C054A000]
MRLREEAKHDAAAWFEDASELCGSSSKALPELRCVDAESLVECAIRQGQVLD